MNRRTDLNPGGRVKGCKKCRYEALSLQDPKLVDEYKNNYTQITYSTEIGDATESYVEKILIESNHYDNVIHLGNIGADSDIAVTINDITYYAQIKTLTQDKKINDKYFMKSLKHYHDNMLIIMVNKARTRFAVDFQKIYHHILPCIIFMINQNIKI